MRKSTGKTDTTKPPWERESPPRARHHALTSAEKSDARRHAKAAGRPYPNLVDNMREARLSRKKGR